MLGDYTIKDRYQLYTQGADGTLTLVGDHQTAFMLLSSQLDVGKPSIIGVDYKTDSPNPDGTDHFMIVNGRGYDTTKQQYYFTYIETGRSKDQINEAIDSKNRLYYDKTKSTFSGSKYWSKQDPIPTYTITQIRSIK